MIEEIRIYYESIEQANHLIYPIIKNKISENKIKLVRLKGSYEDYSKRVAPIIFWKNPDILITVIKNKEEFPLVQIEFSNAVFTEDHELQRFDGLVASAENNCIYAKISPLNKTSDSLHGGNTNFDYLSSFALIYKKFKKIFYHFNWECDKKGNVLVNSEYLSCPRKISELEIFLERLMDFSSSNKNFDKEWIEDFQKKFSEEDSFKKWQNSLKKFPSSDLTSLRSSRTYYDSSEKRLYLKFNRFGHAMDPERGMLSYYGTLYDNIYSKMIFNENKDSWYKATNNYPKIKKYILEKGLNETKDFLNCFIMATGLDKNSEFLENLKNLKSGKLDLTKFVKNNYFKLNKSLRTIFRYSKGFIISNSEDKKIIEFFWETKEIKESYKEFKKYIDLIEREDLSEDDVTYITAHQIMKENDYRVIAISYPGAQSDRRVLVDPSKGRSQERKYIDVVAYLPKKVTNLQENKGSYKSPEIKYEIECLSKYKDDKKYIKGLNDFLDKFDTNAPKKISIGVGFWAGKNFSISKIKDLDLKKLDYFVYISEDKKEWIIWNQGKNNFFKKPSGKVNLPLTYELN